VRFFEQVIKRPVLTTAILIAIVGLAAHALIGLGIGVDPGLGRPAISISVPYSGVSTATVEREVVRPIERRVAGIPGIVRSEATARDDQGRVTLYFDFASDLHRAFQSIYDSVAVVRRELPIQAGEPVITHDDRRGPVLGPLGLVLTPMMLLGLALAIGILMDDAIVVRESIVRHRQVGTDSPATSTGRPATPVATVVLGTLATIAVVGPLAHTGGVAGNLLSALAITFIVATLVSSLSSVTFVPFLSRGARARRERGRRAHVTSLKRVDLWFDAAIDRYHELLASVLNHRRRTAAVAAVLLAMVAAIRSATGTVEMIPAPHPPQSPTEPADSSDTLVDLEIRGPDSRTLVGLGQHIAEESMTVPGIHGISVWPTVTTAEGPAEIDHLDTIRVAHVRLRIPETSAHDILSDLTDRLALIPLPPGYRLTQSGDIVDRNDMFRRVAEALGLSAAIVYLLLAIRWRSVAEPLAVLAALPLVLIGVLGATLITGATVNLFTLVGAGFCMALLVRHATPLIETARARLAHDLSMRVSLIEAARVRFRPVVAATIAVLAWMIPVAFTGGASAGPYRALGIAVIGGTIASVVTTLLIVPMLYSAVGDLRERGLVWLSTLRSVSSSVLPLEPGD